MDDQVAGAERRQPDSVEQIEAAKLPNPITGEDEALVRPGDAQDEGQTNDDTLDEGPEPNVQQMPR